jgi:CSLREA domain-containing protein
MSTTSYSGPLALIIWAALAAGVTAVVLASPAWAATLAVTTASDAQPNTNGECSLREAIINANQNNQSGSTDCSAGGGADRIVFDLGTSATITLTSQLPTITDGAGLTVDGRKAHVSVSGDDAARVFEVGSAAKLALRNLTVEKGSADLGDGGGVLNRGTLTVSGSTLWANRAPGGSGGGIANLGTAAVSNSTLSANGTTNGLIGGGAGGGIANLGTITVTNSTLSGNSATNGDGIANNSGTTTLKNTIVSDGSPGRNCSVGSGAITDGGHNLSSDNSCVTAATSLPGVTNLMLGPLADNGGPTPTHALGERSPAVDKGRSFGATADQRGLPRPTDLGLVTNAPGGDGSDIGAYEQVRCSGGVVNAAGTVIGTNAGEVLSGGDGDDFIFGLGGNDRITGAGGNDEVCSGKGNDTLIGGPGNDTLLAGEGRDNLRGDGGDDILEGLLGDDTLNTVDRMRRNDTADGGPGQDTCKTDRGDERKSC